MKPLKRRSLETFKRFVGITAPPTVVRHRKRRLKRARVRWSFRSKACVHSTRVRREFLMSVRFRSGYKIQKQRERDINAEKTRERLRDLRENLKRCNFELEEVRNDHTVELAKLKGLEAEVRDLEMVLRVIEKKAVPEVNNYKVQSLERKLRATRANRENQAVVVEETTSKLDAIDARCSDIVAEITTLIDIEEASETRLKNRDDDAKSLTQSRATYRAKRMKNSATPQPSLSPQGGYYTEPPGLEGNPTSSRVVMNQDRLRERLKKNLRETRKAAAEKDAQREDAMRKRTEAVMSLKRNIAVARARDIEAKERQRKRDESSAREWEAIMQDMIRTHPNPEAALRARDVEKDAEKKLKRFIRQVQEQRTQILDDLLSAERRADAADKAMAAEKESVQSFNEEMGYKGRQRRLDAYMASRADVDPSTGLLAAGQGSTGQVTTLHGSKVVRRLVRKSFGLGRASKDEIAREHRKFPDAVPNEKIAKIPDVYSQPKYGGTHIDQAQTYAANRLTFVKMSTLMEQKINEARQESEAKRVRGEPKKILGKVYRDATFLCNPAVIHFDDFLVHSTYRRRVTLTNVSFTFNSFRCEGVFELPSSSKTDLPDPRIALAPPKCHSSLFDIVYTPKGRMAAGRTAVVDVEFSPIQNEDTSAVLWLASESGPVKVPIECKTRRVDVHLSTQQMILGPISVGQSIRREITITNRGKLSVGFKTKVESGVTEGEVTLADAKKSIKISSTSTRLEAESTAKIILEFSPKVPGSFDLCANVLFGKPDDKCDRGYPLVFGSPSTFSLRIHCEACPVPVYVERPEIDLQVCIVGKLYRAPIILFNRGTSAARVAVLIPKALRDCLRFTPREGYVQTDTPFFLAAELKTPSLSIAKESLKDFFDPKSRTLRIDLTLEVPSQALPVKLSLRATVSPDTLVFSIAPPPQKDKRHDKESIFPLEMNENILEEEKDTLGEQDTLRMDFGTCSVHSEVSMAMTIMNVGDVLQRLGFVEVPQSASVEPSPFVAILPGKTVTRHVIFRPLSATSHDFDLKCVTSLGKVYHIKCKGLGVLPNVRVGHPALRMAATADGHEERCSTMITNSTDTPLVFSIGCPIEPKDDRRKSFLSVYPCSGSLGPRETRRLEVVFRPSIYQKSYIEHMLPPPPPKPLEAVDSNENEKSSRKKNRRAPLDRKRSELKRKKNSKGSKNGDSKGDGYASAIPTPATTVDAKHEVGEDEIKKNYDLSSENPEESQDPDVRTRCLFEDLISYSSPSEPWSRHGRHILTVDAAPAKSVRANRAGESKKGEVASVERGYLSVTTCIVKPIVNLDPKQISFGRVFCGSRILNTLYLKNTSIRPIEIKTKPLSSGSPFSLLNATRTIPKGGALGLRIAFSPQVERGFAEVFEIVATDTRLCIPLVGQGIRPVLDITYDKSQMGYLDMGDIVRGDESIRVIKIHNRSRFSTKLSVEFIDKLGEPANRSRDGRPVFDIVPSTVQMDAGSWVNLTCHFSSDWASLDFATTVSIGSHILNIKGRCHKRQLYVIPPPPPVPIGPPHPLKAILPNTGSDPADKLTNPFSFLEENDGGERGEEGIYRPMELELVMVSIEEATQLSAEAIGKTDKLSRKRRPKPAKRFPSRSGVPAAEEPGEASQLMCGTLTIGSCALQMSDKAKNSSKVSFEITLEEDYKSLQDHLTVDPASRALAFGEKVKVLFKFNAATYRQELARADEGETMTGSVRAVFTYKLKGGYVSGGGKSAGAAEQSGSVHVLVRGLHKL